MKKISEKMIKRVERVFKGVANKNRIKIIVYIETENITSVWAISQGLKMSIQNVSQHLIRLEKAGLIDKHQNIREVYHELTPYGEKVLKFIFELA